MKRFVSVLLILILAVLVPAASSLAGSRYHSKHYYGGYRSHYYPHYYGHSHRHSDDFLAYLGVGLLAGVVAGSIFYQPPITRTVVHSAPPPPVIVYRSPVVVRPQSDYYLDNEVLRQVKATARVLNIRSGPGFEEEIIGQAVLGEILGVIGAAPEWLYVKTQRGQYGWVMEQYTQALEGPVG